MADPKGFLTWRERELPPDRPVEVRRHDWGEVHAPGPVDGALLARQAGRCMDCGVPFCHHGCPLGNLIPEWNDLVRRGRWAEASERLHATNNFPEFTGRVCPAPCETACVLGIDSPPVTIKSVEVAIADTAFDQGTVQPQLPQRLTGFTVAVVGSGPAGLAAAQQLTRAGHTVAVYERDEHIGGLLRYGIPSFKLDKAVLDRRLAQMEAEGTRLRPGVAVGTDLAWADIHARYDAVVIATGATVPRDLAVPGRELAGIHFAMEFLHAAADAVAGRTPAPAIDAAGRHVVVVGGGDTGSDCVGTCLRQGAASVVNLEITPRPPQQRPASQPWPTYPMVYRVSSSHEEGGVREYRAATIEARPGTDGRVGSLVVAEADDRFAPVPGTAHEIEADLVLISMGFTGPETDTLTPGLGLATDPRGRLVRTADFAAPLPGVFVAGDAGRGQSLVVWAIAEGRACAAAVDRYLQARTELPAPVDAEDVSLRR